MPPHNATVRSIYCTRSQFFIQGVTMKLLAALIASMMLFSVPAFAGSHGGGKMDDKKVDCSKKENEKHADCQKK